MIYEHVRSDTPILTLGVFKAVPTLNWLLISNQVFKPIGHGF